MKVDLDTLRGFFRSAPFMVDLGIEPILVCEAHVIKPGRQVSFTEAEVCAETDGQRVLVAKASATMSVVAQR